MPRVRMTALHWLGAAWLAYATASLWWSPSGSESIWHMGVIAGCFAWGSTLRGGDMRPLWIGLALGVTVNSVIVLFQVNGITVVPQTHPPAGLLVNKMVLGWLAAMVLIALIREQLWWFIPGVLPSFLLTEARAAALAFCVAGVAWLWPRNRKCAVVIALGIVLMAAGVWKSNYRISSIDERAAIWADTWDALTPSGRGIGSYLYYFPLIDTRLDTSVGRAEHAHSDYLEFAFELGVGALPLFALAAMVFAVRRETERLVFLAYLVIAIFGFPSFIPATAAVGAVVAGRLARGWGLVRLPRRAGRPRLHGGWEPWGPGWALAGRKNIPR